MNIGVFVAIPTLVLSLLILLKSLRYIKSAEVSLEESIRQKEKAIRYYHRAKREILEAETWMRSQR